MSANFFLDNNDLLFHFDKSIDWASIGEATEFGFTLPGGPKTVGEGLEMWREVATMVGEFVGEEIAPKSALLDKQHGYLVDGETVEGEATRQIFARLKEIELHKLCLPRELGGMNAPMMLYFLVAEMLARADVSTMEAAAALEGLRACSELIDLPTGPLGPWVDPDE